jgi:hypothetical protein
MRRNGLLECLLVGRVFASVGLVASLVAVSCRAPNSEHPSTSVSTSVQPSPMPLVAEVDAGVPLAAVATPSVTLATEIATAWLEALRRRDVSALVAHTEYPFDLRDTGTAGRLGEHEVHLTATNASAMQDLIKSLVTDDVLSKTMRAERDGRVKAFKKDGYIYSWAEQWRGDLLPDLRPLSVRFQNNDAAFTFIFLVGKSGVRALWKTGFDATVEVELVTRWLLTLRHRDIRALERLTSYPFELRDNQLGANCGSRMASGPTEMRAALACLLDDALFNEALKADSIVSAGLKQDFVPGFFEGWRRPEHADLWPTMVLIGTDAGNEYDLTMLVAKNGVRVLWKRGSFSPPD